MNEITTILDKCKYLHLGLVDGDEPYVVPMNYGYTMEDDKLTIYLHGATVGKKLDLMRANPKVFFEMDCDVTPFEGKVACQYGITYASIMGRGVATIVEDVEEKKKQIINRITKGCRKTTNPICIYIGGQPGCGKSTASRRLRNNNNENGLVDVSLDNYRSYHPNYLKIEECIKKHWEERVETDNNTKGNDIADFTHNFAGLMSDKVLDDLSDKGYNIVLEWGMRTPEIPIQRMKDMKSKGYTNIVDFILVHQDISREACRIRANIMNTFNHIIRRVPNYFHDMCISTLPSSAKQIYEIAYKQDHNIDQFMLTDRKNRIIWDHTHTEDIQEVYEEYLNNPELSKEFANNQEKFAITSYNEEQQGFQEELKSMLNDKEEIEELNEYKEK